MTRAFLVALTAWAAFPLAAAAEPKTSPSETLIQLTVRPAAAPKPALRYLLLPELKEMNPGNPIPNYMKCFMEQQKFFFDKEAFERRDKLLAMPLKELASADLQDVFSNAGLRQADWAARLDRPDWQILPKLKTDGIGLLLPDVQVMRALAQALKLRFRAEVATCRFDDAVRTAKTMFALARHMGEHPTLIGDLVAIAIAHIAVGPLEEMLEQPGCPNLYWALTNLPSPFISLEKGMDGERVNIRGEFRELDDTAPMSEEQIKKVIVHVDGLLRVIKNEQKPLPLGETTRAWLDARNKDEKYLSAARHRLVEAGYPEERLRRFPVDQVLLLDEFREFEARRDDVMKLMNLPTREAVERGAEWERKTKAATREGGVGEGLFLGLLPALSKVRQAQGRLEQRIALLRHVEALRLYAAEHDGKLPEKLSDSPVPLPDDPFTGKRFRYSLEGGTAHLRGTPPPGGEKIPGFNIHYEVTIQK
jgi:hypothetical protein